MNFLSPHIFEVTKRRLAQKKGTIEPFRLLQNMLSSQPMCFNLFANLVDDVELATDLMRVILPEKVNRVTKVILEYAPEPAKNYLNDLTAFDAFVAYTDHHGQPGFAGIETKLTEAFSAKVYSSPFYSRWLEHPKAPWPAVVRPRLQAIEVNQLWRDHLLAVAMRLSTDSDYASGCFMLIYHPSDAECVAALEVYKTLLYPGDDSFISMPLDRLVALWRGAVASPEHRNWIDNFSHRYLDLEASQAEFQSYQAR